MTKQYPNCCQNCARFLSSLINKTSWYFREFMMFQLLSFLQSIEQIPLRRMIYRKIRMIKSIFRTAPRTNFLQHPDGWMI